MYYLMRIIIVFLACTYSAFAQSEAQTADYVIVGAGTAGSYLAKKLSDDMKTSVVAIHNGANRNHEPIIYYSRNADFTVLDSLSDWELFNGGNSINQVNANNRQLHWVIASPLGGDSAVSAETYVMGTKDYFASWEAITGSKLWSVERIFNIYRDIEHYEGQTTNPKFRGTSGLLHVRQNPFPTQAGLKFNQAIINATGIPLLLDYNDPNANPIGAAAQIQSTVFGRDGIYRMSSAHAFLNPAVISEEGYGVNGRKLQIFFNSTAAKIIWNGNKAIGVEYIQNGQVKQIYAKKEVIVTAGLYSSPFLQRSGIGPRKLLESLKIPVIFDNPNVGNALGDQPHLLLLYTSNLNDTPISPNSYDTKLTLNIVNKFPSLIGTPLAKQLLDINNLKTKKPLPRDKSDIFFGLMAFLPDPAGDQKTREFTFTIVNPIPGLSVFMISFTRHQSHGSITISSQDPYATPVIDFGTFTNPADLALDVRGIQTYIPAISKALKEIDPNYALVYPDIETIKNKELLTSFIKNGITSTMTFQGHCRMAPLNQGGVVDSTGHVYGVKNLIVADASIVPDTTDGGPLAVAYLIAANIGRMLLDQ